MRAYPLFLLLAATASHGAGTQVCVPSDCMNRYLELGRGDLIRVEEPELEAPSRYSDLVSEEIEWWSLQEPPSTRINAQRTWVEKTPEGMSLHDFFSLNRAPFALRSIRDFRITGGRVAGVDFYSDSMGRAGKRPFRQYSFQYQADGRLESYLIDNFRQGARDYAHEIRMGYGPDGSIREKTTRLLTPGGNPPELNQWKTTWEPQGEGIRQTDFRWWNGPEWAPETRYEFTFSEAGLLKTKTLFHYTGISARFDTVAYAEYDYAQGLIREIREYAVQEGRVDRRRPMSTQTYAFDAAQGTAEEVVAWAGESPGRPRKNVYAFDCRCRTTRIERYDEEYSDYLWSTVTVQRTHEPVSLRRRLSQRGIPSHAVTGIDLLGRKAGPAQPRRKPARSALEYPKSSARAP